MGLISAPVLDPTGRLTGVKKFWLFALLTLLFGIAAKRIHDADHPENRHDLDRFDKEPGG